MASLLCSHLCISPSPALVYSQGPRRIPSLLDFKCSARKSMRYRSLMVSSALVESDSPKSVGDETLPLFQELADSFRLPPDYFTQLPRDLRLDLNDAAFDLANGPVVDECGQELGEMLLNLSQAWEQADTSTSTSIVSKLPSLQGSLSDNAKSAFGKRLLSAGRRFEAMGQYGQGELQRIAKNMVKTGKVLSAIPAITTTEKPKMEARTLKFGELQVELTPAKANIGAAIEFFLGNSVKASKIYQRAHCSMQMIMHC
ncbi:uncharacterized protein [Aristolochia californica]|uniref:uncharacterized protein isoform X2 n=1 Tax=Aristolochia californica TaxID=171875 RepID=UPI0035D9F1B6